MLFVLQMRPLPGTSVLYLSVALEPNLLLLALLRLAVGLARGAVEVQCLAVWCCLVSILFVCVFGLTSALTDVRDGKWRLVCGVFSGLGKGPLLHVSNVQNEQSWSRFAPDRTVWASTWAWSAEVWLLFGPLIHGGVLKQTLWIQHFLALFAGSHFKGRHFSHQIVHRKA